MNLNQYVAENPLKNLVDIQAYAETATRMISNKTMGLYLRGTAMYLIVHEIAAGKLDIAVLDDMQKPTSAFTNHPAKELCLLIVNSLAGSTTDNDDFNFIRGNSIGDAIIADTENLRDNTLVEFKPRVAALLNKCLAHCNITSQPFLTVTQADVDAAKARLNPSTEEATYPSDDYILNKHRVNTSIEITITEPLPFTDTISFTCQSGNTEVVNEVPETSYSTNLTTRAIIPVPANFVGSLDTGISLKSLKTKVKAFGASKYNRNFSAKIYNTGS